MILFLNFGGVKICVDSERKLIVDERLQDFVIESVTAPDVVFQICWADGIQPIDQALYVGEDLLRKHYRDGECCYCVAKGGVKGISASTEFAPDFSYLRCTINDRAYIEPLVNLSSILRFCPMMALFQHFGVLFFHASQIEYSGKGILFTAPSGIGKSTQARLWADNRGARILCNDRTIVRRSKEGYLTYGYPIDGSAPVSSCESAKLGAIVLLSQAPTDQIERIPFIKAVTGLMPQVVFDTWNPDARAKAMDGLIELVSDIPIYKFGCTKEITAVECLEKQLISDGVIENG